MLVSGIGGYWARGRGGWIGGRDSFVQGLAGHGTHFRLYSECNGNLLKGLEQRSGHISRKRFDCG